MNSRLVTSVLLGLVGITTVAQADPSRPRLVVGIVVDQLRDDYLVHLRSLFGEKGFRRLMDKGVYMRDVDFGVNGLDAASATAMLYTGNYPAATGVPSAEIYDPSTGKSLPALTDPSALGNFTQETYSPVSLRLSTLSDEVAADGAGLGAVYSIAPDPRQAVIMAGHAANAALWINGMTGQWAGSTYYRDMPQSVSRRNYSSPLSARLDTMQWKPMLPLDRYPGIPAQKKHYPFRYTFPTSGKDVYGMFVSSPLVNAEVTDVAISCMGGLSLGSRGDAVDMLNIGYTLAPFKYVADGDFRLELQDAYLRLDAQLGRLLDEIDRKVGLDNTLVWLSSTGYYDDAAPENPLFRIPSGDFSLKRALSLLNAYMSARYGNGDYVATMAGPYIYLDHRAFESRGIDVKEAAAEARGFMRRMSGVAEAYTPDELLASNDPDLVPHRRRVDRKTAGDIYLVLAPGWNRVDDLDYPVRTGSVRMSMIASPAFILAPGLKPEVITVPVDAATLAPTVSSLLRIRSPNGAARRPLPL